MLYSKTLEAADEPGTHAAPQTRLLTATSSPLRPHHTRWWLADPSFRFLLLLWAFWHCRFSSITVRVTHFSIAV
jgi:hypothetical protein